MLLSYVAVIFPPHMFSLAEIMHFNIVVQRIKLERFRVRNGSEAQKLPGCSGGRSGGAAQRSFTLFFFPSTSKTDMFPFL